MISEKEIKKKYPSKCYKCMYARNVAEALLEKGYCGCMVDYFSQVHSPRFSHLTKFSREDIKCEDAGYGWVKNSKPFGEQNVAMVNDTLMVKCVSQCEWFEKISK